MLQNWSSVMIGKQAVITAFIACAALLVGTGKMEAGQFVFDTAPNSQVEGENVSAKAVITTSAGAITIDVFNLFANPNAANQAISGLNFTTSSPVSIDPAALTQRTGDLFNINNNGTYTPPVTSELTRWDLVTPST